MTNLTGENFQRAHLALMDHKAGRVRGRVRRVPYCSNETAVMVKAVAVAVGIILGVALLLGAASCGMARGAAWECGNYATAPAWND